MLTLNRRRDSMAEDELDDVVHALNDMYRLLQSSYDQIRQSEERFDLAMRGANDGLWDWDMKRNRVYYSPRWKGMLGYKHDELSDDITVWQDRIHPDDLQSTEAELRRHLRGGSEQLKSVHRLLHRNGQYRWILTRGQALRDEDGTPYRLVGTNMDITIQKETEAALKRATRELEEEQERRVKAERLACVGELAASIAHEIRNPLASIINCLALIHIDSMDPQERDSVIEILNTETRRLQRILDDFLEFARVRPATLMIADVVKIIEETIEAISLRLPSDGSLKVVTNFHTSSCFAHLDEGQIRQVLWNLMLNSIQAMSDGGTLYVSTQAISGRVCVTIRDTGSGIPGSLRDRIMDPFVTGREGGTGLGLAIVQRILMQHDSELYIDSEPGRGTESKFHLDFL